MKFGEKVSNGDGEILFLLGGQGPIVFICQQDTRNFLIAVAEDMLCNEDRYGNCNAGSTLLRVYYPVFSIHLLACLILDKKQFVKAIASVAGCISVSQD